MPAAHTHIPWPESLANTPSVSVIEQAIATRRLSHSILLTGDDIETLTVIAEAIADRLLNTSESTAYFPPAGHPDCYALRPVGKMRQIGADPTRENLIAKLQVSPTVSAHKVGIVYECDRMNTTAANVFLKTLEEPPRNSTLLLLTTRPYSLLPTIRSRCLHFRFPSMPAAYSPGGWTAWLADYKTWLGQLSSKALDRRAVSDSIFSAYGLITRFGTILDFATKEIWEQQKQKLRDDLDEKEIEAIETGIANGLRTRLFIEIEQATRDYAVPALATDDERTSIALTEAITSLEHAAGLLRLNLNESAALENFMLTSLRIWARR